ncbi:hypothetical protein ABZ470_39705 [Streptosporangium sp. NPDC020072]|uniref:hypothetical protein n=1 Tax=Streptosporangium sp. NPDC020072 TaxID=3154788 RepID=UPI0034272AE7
MLDGYDGSLDEPCEVCGAAEGWPCGPPCIPGPAYDVDGFGNAYSDADPGL